MTDWKMPEWMREIILVADWNPPYVEEMIQADDYTHKAIIEGLEKLRTAGLLFTGKEILGGMPIPMTMKRFMDKAKADLQAENDGLQKRVGELEEEIVYLKHGDIRPDDCITVPLKGE